MEVKKKEEHKELMSKQRDREREFNNRSQLNEESPISKLISIKFLTQDSYNDHLLTNFKCIFN